jgi:hypothetical protein
MIDPERRAAALAEHKRRVGLLQSKRCIHCEQPVERYEQVGRCVYADPCGHRQYQGRIPA